MFNEKGMNKLDEEFWTSVQIKSTLHKTNNKKQNLSITEYGKKKN